jgi:hyperosmotically inducible periplasmic protein
MAIANPGAPQRLEIPMTVIRTLLLTLALAIGVSACAVIRGQEGVSQYTTDASITTAVKASYAKDPTVAATAIGVETLDGIVQLSGFAKSAAEKSRAEALAKQVEGVKSVRNDVIVRP